MEQTCILLSVFVILMAVGVWFVRKSNDRERVRRYVESIAGEILSIENHRHRTYLVHFLDRDGNEHLARCASTGAIGILMGEDRIIGKGSPKDESIGETLEEENRRLRERVAEL